jgi:hypothetical protein
MARLDLITGVMCLCLLTAAGGEGLWCMRTWPDNILFPAVVVE